MLFTYPAVLRCAARVLYYLLYIYIKTQFVNLMIILRPICQLFILHRAILVISIIRYARKVLLAFIVGTISR